MEASASRSDRGSGRCFIGAQCINVLIQYSKKTPPSIDDLSSSKPARAPTQTMLHGIAWRSDEHTSELQSLMRISYDDFCLKNKTQHTTSTESLTIKTNK